MQIILMVLGFIFGIFVNFGWAIYAGATDWSIYWLAPSVLFALALAKGFNERYNLYRSAQIRGHLVGTLIADLFVPLVVALLIQIGLFYLGACFWSGP